MHADAGWWLGGYLGLGALVILLLRGVVSAYGIGWRHRPEPPRGPQTWRELQEHRQWAVFAFFAWWIWPLAALIIIKKIVSPSQLDQNDRCIAQAADPQYAFVYKRRTTCRKVSRAEALAMGQLEPDPLGRMPNVAFGHLNPAWEAMVGAMAPGDTLRYFTISPRRQRQDGPQWPHHRGALRGLAVLRKRLVQAELVFESDHGA